MSWEVSSMPSKRFFFNRTLFRKNLSRFWPMWGGVSLVGAMAPLYLLLSLLQRQAQISAGVDFARGLYQIATYFVPGFTCGYAILCVMAVWGWLYNARATGLMHALPVDRTCLFVTNTVSALAMVLIPYAVAGGLLCLLALGWRFFDLVAVVNTVAAVLMIAVLFTGMASLCAMLTGHAFVLPVFYLLANFLATILEMLTTSLVEAFLLGVGLTRHLGFLSPVVQIYASFHAQFEYLPDGALASCQLQGLWAVALYALAGLGMLALAWFLYRCRHSERAGDVVAFRWLRPVFRYGVALLSGLTIGRLLFELLWAPIFQHRYYADRVPMGVCLFLGGLLGYYAASMLLEKSLRVFRGSWRGGLIVAAGAAVLCLLVSVDAFGVERRVPALEEIESVSLWDRGLESGPFKAEDNPAVVEHVRQFHQAIVDDRAYIRAYAPDFIAEEGKAFSHFVRLVYQLRDGTKLERAYDLWLSRDRVNTAGTYDNLLAEFYQDPVVRAADVTLPEGAEVNSISIICDYMAEGYANSMDHAGGRNTETLVIYEALQRDAAEGNIPARDVLQFSGGWDRGGSRFYLELECCLYMGWRDSSYKVWYKPVYLSPSMTNTLNALVELGYVTQLDLAAWREDLAAAE